MHNHRVRIAHESGNRTMSRMKLKLSLSYKSALTAFGELTRRIAKIGKHAVAHVPHDKPVGGVHNPYSQAGKGGGNSGRLVGFIRSREHACDSRVSTPRCAPACCGSIKRDESNAHEGGGSENGNENREAS